MHTVHTAFNPENHLIITYWLCCWSLNTVTSIFLMGESNPYSVALNWVRSNEIINQKVAAGEMSDLLQIILKYH
jgi:hypothetical protein